MEIINFEEVKAGKQSKARNQSGQKITEHLPETVNGVLEIQRQYREMVQFFEQWYDEHVIG